LSEWLGLWSTARGRNQADDSLHAALAARARRLALRLAAHGQEEPEVQTAGGLPTPLVARAQRSSRRSSHLRLVGDQRSSSLPSAVPTPEPHSRLAARPPDPSTLAWRRRRGLADVAADSGKRSDRPTQPMSVVPRGGLAARAAGPASRSDSPQLAGPAASRQIEQTSEAVNCEAR
jgi:hypothetical protein